MRQRALLDTGLSTRRTTQSSSPLAHNRGVQAIEQEVEEAISVAQAPLWGLGGTIMHEHPEFHCTCVDLSAECRDDEITSLWTEFWTNTGEAHLAFRQQKRYVARLVRTPSTTGQDARQSK